jgi:hypothetical protein
MPHRRRNGCRSGASRPAYCACLGYPP